MSQQFQQVMRDISNTLKEVYHAHSLALVPGGGTYGMEAVVRQFAGNKKCLVIRNGWFSYRWSQIFESGNIPSAVTVLKARPVETGAKAAFAPAPIEEVVATIEKEQPDLVFAPHVETASGIILPQDYLEQVATAVHKHGGLFVLDCIASGTIWVDMEKTGVDILISAPQKGWSSTPCAALVMFSQAAANTLESTKSSSFALDLKKWRDIMAAYENGGHAYYATLPTDAITQFRNSMLETRDTGFDKVRAAQQQLGDKVRALLAARGFKSVAAKGFEAPGVVVSYTDDDSIHKGSAFIAQNMQTAAGVPLACDEPEGFKTFRLGLFGLDKLTDVEAAVKRLENTLNVIMK
jgi:aspartate aminotransferase-like enzyme